MVSIIRILIVVGLIAVSTTHAGAVAIKIATLSPEGSIWMEKMRQGADEIAQKTHNRVTIKYYPGGVMGDDKTVLSKIRLGQLHGGAFVAGSMAQVSQDVQIYALPMKFKSIDEVDYVRKSMDQLIIEQLEKKGFITFGLADGGFAYLMSNEPVKTLEEVRKKKVWIPDNDSMALEAVRAFGINPIPLSIADVRAGLQTGLIDTIAASPIGAVALQWHTQVKYLLDLPMLYLYAVFAVDANVFHQLSAADQQIVRDTLNQVFQEIDRINHEDNLKAVDALKKQGVQFVQPPPEAAAEWNRMASTVSSSLSESGKISGEMIKTLEALLSKYHQEHKN